MLTVSQIARRAEVSADTVRHYAHIGLLKPERNPQNGYKIFSEMDIGKLRFIRQAQSLGFTLAEIADIFSHSTSGDSPCPQVREVMQQRIIENKKKLEALNALQQRMEKALALWNSMPDGHPDGHSVCHLIESVGQLEAKT
jgi:MerR family Zn(II)-responsive transcriptional regulator of zntA